MTVQTRDDIEAIVVGAVEMTNMAREPDQQLDTSKDAILYGPGSSLDSLGLVGLIIDVEEAFQDAGIEISLNNDSAMSQTKSPFQSIRSLVDYIASIV